MLSEVVQWRNLAWWRACQAVGICLEGRRATTWRRKLVGQPPLTWESVLVHAWGEDWIGVLRDCVLSFKTTQIVLVKCGFVKTKLSIPVWGAERANKKLRVTKMPVTKPRLVEAMPSVTLRTDARSIFVYGDSQVVVNWFNAISLCKQRRFVPIVERMWQVPREM